MRSLVPLKRQYNVNMGEDVNQLKFTCKHCNCFVTCSNRSGELRYITFLHSGMYNLRLYPVELVSDHFYFQCPSRTKIKRICKNILKEGNGGHKYLMPKYLRDNNFEFLRIYGS